MYEFSNRRSFIKAAGAMSLTMTPMALIPATALSNPLAIAGQRALINILLRSAVESTVKDSLGQRSRDSLDSYANNFYREFSGDIVTEFLGEAWNKMPVSAYASVDTNTLSAQYLSAIEVSNELIEMRNALIKRRGKRLIPGAGWMSKNWRPPVLDENDLMILDLTMEKRRSEGWNEKEISAAYTPIGTTRRDVENSGVGKTLQSDALKKHLWFQTPTGYAIITQKRDIFKESLLRKHRHSAYIEVRVNPNLEFCGSNYRCSSVHYDNQDFFEWDGSQFQF